MGKINVITGRGGTGKSTFTALFARCLQVKSLLLIDLVTFPLGSLYISDIPDCLSGLGNLRGEGIFESFKGLPHFLIHIGLLGIVTDNVVLPFWVEDMVGAIHQLMDLDLCFDRVFAGAWEKIYNLAMDRDHNLRLLKGFQVARGSSKR
jgi:energy-coupling factor transporter ATP-binding protein EcfA2